MSADEKMTLEERRKYLKVMQKRYCEAGRVEQGQLLDEMVSVTGLHRKSLIRLLGGDLHRQPRGKQRGRSYGIDVHIALSILWESSDYICAERLQPNLVWLAGHLERHGELTLTPELLAKLGTVSISTVSRILARLQQDQSRLPRRGPQAANQARRQVPIQIIPWNETQPGHFEVDLVHHGGASSEGGVTPLSHAGSGRLSRRGNAAGAIRLSVKRASQLLEHLPAHSDGARVRVVRRFLRPAPLSRAGWEC